jgi:DNA-binding HxlR family transcriptional regulator
MKGYGQFCPVAKAAELFCERWTPLIIRDLVAGATRFSQLRRGVPLMSATLLARRLRQLEAEGVIERRHAAGSRRCTYHLTAAGEEFAPLVAALGTWGQRWSRRQLADDEVDLGLLVWSLESGVRASAFGSDRTVVRLRFVDQPDGKDFWWFVNENGSCELCLKDPGFEVDLYLSTTLRMMIHIVRGDISLGSALDSGSLEAIGSRQTRRKLGAWLNLGPLTSVRSQRPDFSPPAPSRAA